MYRASRFLFRTGTIGILLLGDLVLPNCRHREEDPVFQLAEMATISCLERTSRAQSGRVFSTGFESLSDFSSFYIVPQNYQNAASHNLSPSAARSGVNGHNAWIYAAGPTCSFPVNCNHRAYPTIQLHKLPGGGFRTPVLVDFWVNLNMTVADQQWVSFATFSTDAGDAWSRTVLVNLGNLNRGSQNFVHLMHVPDQGRSDWTYQTTETNDPRPFQVNQWVHLTVCLDLNPVGGSAKVWQDGVLVSQAPVNGGCGILEQAHFGLYAIPTISSGSLFNDDLTIREIGQCP